jgi:hypothetical protein
MIKKLLVGVAGGFALHWTKPAIDSAVVSPGWNAMTRYTVGVVGTYPLARWLHDDDDVSAMRDGARFDASWWLAFLAFGLGVAIAQLAESAYRNQARWGVVEVRD